MTTMNGTTSPRDNVAQIFLVFNCLVLSLTFLLGIPGNLLVCWMVYRNRGLQTANNALLVNLATTDLLKCSVDTPLFLFSILMLAVEHEVVSVYLCTMQQFTYALCSCVHLLTLVSISIDRFQAIAFPFQIVRRKARIRVWIFSIWPCGLILAILSVFFSKNSVFYMLCQWDMDSFHKGHLDPFGVYVLVPVWCGCLTLIFIHYARIFKVVRQHSKKVFDSGIKLKPSAARHVWSRHGLAASAPETAPLSSLGSLPAAGSTGKPPLPRDAIITVANANSPCEGNTHGRTQGTIPEIVGAVCLLTPSDRERGIKRMEGKLAQRFGYIIIAFTFFWLPMMVAVLANSILGDVDFFRTDLEVSAMVLTCVPAVLDPLIYTMLTRQFRSELAKLLSFHLTCPLRRKV